MFNFLHIELTSRCQKSCWMCGRRKMEREHPELCNWGDMPLEMVKWIASQVPRGTVVQLHNNGESTLYPDLGAALNLFSHCIRQFNTNAKLLMERADEIIGNLETLTISVIPKDPEAENQFEIVQKFLEKKRERPPQMVYRILGEVENAKRWQYLPGKVARRVLHDPAGSCNYEKKVTVPEIVICLDLLTHLAVDRYGHISLCVRFDPGGNLRLGNINDMTLEEAWNGQKRQYYIAKHILGRRDLCPGCDRCDFYGVPTGQ